MPIYEFHCSGCGKECELLCRIGAKPEDLDCEHCGEKRLVKKVSKCAIGANNPDRPFVDEARAETHSHSHGHGGCGSCSSGSCGSCHH